MISTYLKSLVFALIVPSILIAGSSGIRINQLEYFEKPGLNVMVFDDYYPVGHQGGVAFIQNGIRVATNGDLRLSPDPGQWQPVPKKLDRVVDMERQEIRVSLAFPDEDQHLKGFNPLVYPDLDLRYDVVVHTEGESVTIEVNLDESLPDEWIGKVGFILELVPTVYFGRSYYMDETPGVFPQQANGPVEEDEDGKLQLAALASGKKLVLVPEDDERRFAIESRTGSLTLLDGRATHNNGWFVVRETVAPNLAKGAIRWEIRPNTLPNWQSKPVIQVSQVGYHPKEKKTAVIELDNRAVVEKQVTLNRISPDGQLEEVVSAKPEKWGNFLRYQYVMLDFSAVQEAGLYSVKYGDTESAPIRIDPAIYERHVWQPTVEYFLPVQMCHMRVSEKYRVWHDTCHLDDALMAPVSINHFDGYKQGDSTLCGFNPLEHVPGLNVGGWHDAGDYDLRVESQMNTVYMLALAWEEFRPEIDQTLVDQERRIVEIHHPDGKPDILQQIEHGLLSVMGGYDALGRLYRGIITPTLRQYVLLGDAASMSDNEIFRNPGPEASVDGVWYQKVANRQSMYFDPHREEGRVDHVVEELDDRMVFTEENPYRVSIAIAGLAASSRVLREYNPELAASSLKAAEALWLVSQDGEGKYATAYRTRAVMELFKATGKDSYKQYFIDNLDEIIADFSNSGYCAGQMLPYIKDRKIRKRLSNAAIELRSQIEELKAATPYGVPYEPKIWGAGWLIQIYGVQQYFLNQAWPDLFPKENMLNALNFVLGCHPGENTASFVSGVGANSVLVAYGVNRADWSFIPGGSVSGTALIRPDFPELLEWPFLWQQTEYVMGGGATNFMFMVIAAEKLLK